LDTLISKDRVVLSQQVENHAEMAQEKSQYSLWQIVGIWLAGGAPIWILNWLIYPMLRENMLAADAGLLLIKLLTIGLAWEFVLSMFLLYREERNLRLETIRRRFWLNHPVSSKSNQINKRLWLALAPCILFGTGLQLGLSPILNRLWVMVFPFLAEPQGYGMGVLFAPEMLLHWRGAWELLALFLVNALFNTILGEEFLFRGVLLPRMKGVFGQFDWVANGVLFGLYHLHKPWGILTSIFTGLIYAFTGEHLRSNWFPIILHSGQSLYFTVLILAVCRRGRSG